MAQVLFMGKELFTAGELPKVGKRLPLSQVCTPRLEDISTDKLSGPLLLNIFPSIDTSVCAKCFKTFVEECRSISGLKLMHISCDLPFALDRFLKENKLDTAVLSAFRSDLGEKWGLKLTSGPLRGLLARAVILLDEEDIVRYVELVPEISHEPNFRQCLDAALEL